MTIFVDTGYFVALLAPRDQWHKIAVNALRPGLRLTTSSLVVNETISLLQARGRLSAALEFLQRLRSDPDMQIVHVDARIQSDAWDLFHKWGGAGANAVDCASFAIMRIMSIKKAFTFDRHFRTAGFEILH